jgi:hypothetical protein
MLRYQSRPFDRVLTFAFRVGHTMLSSDFMLDQQGDNLMLADAFFTPELLVETPPLMDAVLAGFTLRNAQRVDTQIINDVRNFLFGKLCVCVCAFLGKSASSKWLALISKSPRFDFRTSRRWCWT